MKPALTFLTAFFLASLTALRAGEVAVSSLDLTQATIHRALVRDKWKTFPNKSAAYFDKEKLKITEQGLPITLAGVVYTNGFGSRTRYRLAVDCHGTADRFTARVGVNDHGEKRYDNVVFYVEGDGQLLWKSPIMKVGDRPQQVDVALTGVKQLVLWLRNGDLPGWDPLLHGVERDPATGRINSNQRFPDLKGFTDECHRLGLKAGIYSTPGPTTCGGCVGSWQHERQDAERFSEWGFDYLKYDWCSYDQVVKGDHSKKAYALKPYAVMDECLRQQKRDLVYSLCQYGMAKVWEWAHEVHGNTWRTTADIGDSWGSVASIGFSQGGHEPYVKPGCWDDPDMMTLGFLGYRWSVLEDDEQYTEMSLWCLLAAPLLLGNDLTKMDEFTHNLLCNDEVIAVDQDPLGRMAACVASEGDTRVYAKAMSDGSLAVGLFNLGDAALPVSATWPQLKLAGPQRVRDLWRQRDLGVKANGFTADVPRHGCILLRIFSNPE